MIEARIDEIKPTVGANNRALDAIVKFRGDGNVFRGGGTVNARVIIQRRENALMVPEHSVVLRPAGKVVYAVQDGVARQRIVETGLRQEGLQEVTQGLQAGETIVVDGAGFLTDGAVVTLAKPKPAAEKREKAAS